MEFGELLRKTLQDNKIKITNFSSLIGMNRMAVYAVFNGKKRLSEDVFELILEKFDFSPAQVAQLNRLYYIDKTSKGRTELLKTLKIEFESAGRPPFSNVMMFKDITVSSQGVFLLGAVDYYSAIKAFLENERDSEDYEIFTNYPFLDTQADSIVYDFVLNKKPSFRLRHTVLMGKDVPIEERLRNVFASVKFGKLGHPVFSKNSKKGTDAFSVHFIGKNTVLQYDPQNECGFLSVEPAVISAYKLVASKNSEDESPLTEYSESAFELRNVLQPYQVDIFAVIGFKFPAYFFTTPDILEDTLKKDIPNRSVVFSAFWNHISRNQTSVPEIMFLQQGLHEFALNGIAYDASLLHLDPISLKHRKTLLERYKKNIIESDYSLKILNSNSFRLRENCELEIFGDSFALMFCNDSVSGGDFIGGCYILLEDKELSDLFKDFYNYSVLSEALLPQEYAEHFVDDLISQCEAALQNTKEN